MKTTKNILITSLLIFSLASAILFLTKKETTNDLTKNYSSVSNKSSTNKLKHHTQNFGTDKLQKISALDPISRTSFSEWIENKGQLENSLGAGVPQVLFYGNSEGSTVFLRNTGITIVPQVLGNLEEDGEVTDSTYIAGHRLDIDFVNCNNSFTIEKQEILPAYKNYYTASHPAGITYVRSYKSIVYRNIYNQVDMICYAPEYGKFKYDFIVNPGASPNTIKLQYNGADSVKILQGILTTYLPNGTVKEWIPKVYQKIAGQEIIRSGNFYKTNETIGISVPNYNPSYPLIIDPWVTYYGGLSLDYGFSITTDPLGNVIFSGNTMSADFPVSPGAFQMVLSGTLDAYIVKMAPNGVPFWTTYYGGSSSEDGGKCVATDASGNIVFTGLTSSSNFPVTPGAYQPFFGGGFNDNYVVKLKPTGLIDWGTFLGGAKHGSGNAICVDSSNNIIVVGLTRSLNFPITPGAYSSTGTGGDGFITKFSSTGGMIWSTYYNNTEFKGVTANSAGEIIVSGYAGALTSTTPGAYKSASADGDAFVAKFSSTGTRMWATSFGGTDIETGGGITTDNDDNILLTGHTLSNDLYVSASAFQKTRAGLWDAFLVKFNSSGFPVWSTYVGGTGNEEAFGVAVEKATGSVYIAGDTYSTNFPTTDCAFQKTLGGGSEDNYIAKFDKDGFRICSGYIGGTGHDEIDFSYPLATHGSNVYLIAEVSGGYPVTADSYQPILAGGQDAVVASLCGNSCSVKTMNLDFASSKTFICLNEEINFSMKEDFLCDTSGADFTWYFPGATPASSKLKNPKRIFYTSPGTYPIHLAVRGGCGKDSIAKTTYITVNGCSLPVELLSFSGRKTEQGNLLEWSYEGLLTRKEKFSIERANDQGEFNFIASVADKENLKSEIFHCQYLDEQADNAINFYRLKYVNENGQEVYSKVISIENYAHSLVRVNPNPSSGIIYVTYPYNDNEALLSGSNYVILTSEGKKIRTGTLYQGSTMIDMNDIADGLYFISIWNEKEGKELTQKFIIRK